jgi:hypothetical protein
VVVVSVGVVSVVPDGIGVVSVAVGVVSVTGAPVPFSPPTTV